MEKGHKMPYTRLEGSPTLINETALRQDHYDIAQKYIRANNNNPIIQGKKLHEIAQSEFNHRYVHGFIGKNAALRVKGTSNFDLRLLHVAEEGPSTERQNTVPPKPADGGRENDGFAGLCKDTFLPEAFFADCEKLLETKGQLILQGAPGTGKTYIAEKLAAWWAGKNVEAVQFHESYGYEDFVQGIRPNSDANAGATQFVLEDGRFLRFCESARSNSAPHVLIIDEINRAKASRVFGELLWLLEYREKEIMLQHGQKFSIPPNVFIIGTMNTVDRSIALVDYALRRRFAFMTLRPVHDGKSVVLNAWLKSQKIANAEEIDRVFVALNTAIAEKEEALMVGHSYLMVEEAVNAGRFDDDLLEFIWRTQILPLVSEYEYQLKSSQIEELYGLAAIRKRAGLSPKA
jgi:hypothetical protein